MNEIIEDDWLCPFCGCEDIWFDRTITYLPDSTEIGMKDRCTQCGRATDELPEAEVTEEVIDAPLMESEKELSESDLRDESY